MLDNFFKGIFDGALSTSIAPGDFLLCLGVALALGFLTALTYRFRTHCTHSFFAALALLPAVVCVVIMLVNGNIGAGVAVAGAFSLVRFRSVPGTAREICALFLAMGIGLISGMGYLGFSALFCLVMCIMFLLYTLLGQGMDKKADCQRVLNITVPEDLNYTDMFQDIFDTYTGECTLIRVRTTNMGSLFKLTYQLRLKDASKEKEMIDALRTRNGNLEISSARSETPIAEL